MAPGNTRLRYCYVDAGDGVNEIYLHCKEGTLVYSICLYIEMDREQFQCLL